MDLVGSETSDSETNVTDAVSLAGRPSRLGEMLVREGLVTSDDVQEALAQQAAGSEWRLGRLLVCQGAIDDLTLSQAIASQFHLPVVELRDMPPRPSALALLPREAAFQLQALPLLVDGDHISVAVADPPTRELRVAIERSTGMSVRLVMCPADELAAALDYWYAADWEIGMASVDNPFTAPVEPVAVVEPAGLGDERHLDDRIVDWLLSEAERQKATAVHLDHDEEGLRVRYRNGQRLVAGPQLPPSSGTVVCERLFAAAKLDPAGEGIREGQFHADVDGRPLTCRVAAASTAAGIHVVLRTCSRPHAGYRLEDLGIPCEDAVAVRRILDNRRGVVVVASVEPTARNFIARTIVDEIGSEDHAIAIIGPQPGLHGPSSIGLRVAAGDPGGVLAAIRTASAAERGRHRH